MTSKFSIDNRELLQRISNGEAVVGIDFGNLIVRELAAFRLAAMDSEPVAENIRIADALEGLLWPNMAIGNKAVIQAAIEALRAYHAQPAPVSLTEAHVAALEEEERSFHDAIRKCIASLRYHHKRAEAHSAGYKGSTLEDDTLKSINLLKRNITAAMLNGGKS